MHIGVFVEGLWVLGVSGVGIDAVEEAVGGVVIPGAEVVVIHVGIVLLAAIQQIRARIGCCRRSAAAGQHHAIGIVAVGLVNRLRAVNQLTRRAVAVVPAGTGVTSSRLYRESGRPDRKPKKSLQRGEKQVSYRDGGKNNHPGLSAVAKAMARQAATPPSKGGEFMECKNAGIWDKNGLFG